MGCPQCGATNKAGRRFCAQCGMALSSICSNCGASNDPDDRFCGQCGTSLGTATNASTAHLIGPTSQRGGTGDSRVAERRLVSVLFADLVGFTPYSEARDAEDVRSMLSRYFELATDIVRRYGGTVEKFIGDAVMAVWRAFAHHGSGGRLVRSAG